MSLDAKILEESGHVPGTGERGERDHAPESEGTEMELEETIVAMIAVNTRGTDPGAETGNSSVYQQLGKIQGDGRKFLDRFKSYFGSQRSPQSLNEIHIYRLQPKSAIKDDFVHIFLSLIVSLSPLTFDLVFQ